MANVWLGFDGQSQDEWQNWFAWRPVRAAPGVWLWGIKVSRRRCRGVFFNGRGPSWWQYSVRAS